MPDLQSAASSSQWRAALALTASGNAPATPKAVSQPVLAARSCRRAQVVNPVLVSVTDFTSIIVPPTWKSKRERPCIDLRANRRALELREQPARQKGGKHTVGVERVRANPYTRTADACGHHRVGQRPARRVRAVEQELASGREDTGQAARVRHVRHHVAPAAQHASGREAVGPLDERGPQRHAPHGCQPRRGDLDPSGHETTLYHTAPPGAVCCGTSCEQLISDPCRSSACACSPPLGTATAAMSTAAQPSPKAAPGILLEDLTWQQAERVLTPDAVVVIPLGAAAKEHGPHLRLKNDFVLAEYFKRRVMAREAVVVAPTVNYHFYPAFVEYPGSTSLRLETARDVVVDICRGLARFGPKRFYVLNTGVSTIRALKPAQEQLASDGIVMHFTDILTIGEEAEKAVRQQQGGTHADEIETSMMLYMDPALVDMRKAAKDYHPQGTGGLTRDPKGKGTYSPTGIWGDATLATREKGRRVVETMVEGMMKEIAALRAAAVPAGR